MPVDPNASSEERLVAYNICRNLSEYHLIEWQASMGSGPDGMGRITASGIDVVEGNAKAPIAITIDKRVTVTGSFGTVIGDGNTQDIHLDADTIFAAVDRTTASTAEKQEAKGLWQKVLDNPILTKVISSLAFGS